MKTVVIVAPSFAPSSYPPAIRTRFFASHLPEFGWRPIVLTVKPEFLEEPQDPEFLALLPPDLEIIRTPAVSQNLTRKFGFGDLGLRSFPFHLKKLHELCRKGIDVILIPGPPWYPFCLGPLLGSRFGIPYVLDYIDPWVNVLGEEASPFSKAWASHRLALLLEGTCVKGASGIVAVSEGTNELLERRYPEIPHPRFAAIPYGFEPGDFEKIRRMEKISEHLLPFKDLINVCYVGAMLPKAHGTLRALFRAIKKLKDFHPGVEKLRFHFFGTTYATGENASPLVLPIAQEEGVGDMVRELPGRIPYLDALKILISANLLLAIGSSEPHYTASKIFPVLQARRPLLALYHQASSVCDVMRAARSGRLIAYSDERPAETCVDSIADSLLEFLEKRTFEYDPRGMDGVAEKFSAREMTRQLAGVLDRAAGIQNEGRVLSD